MKPHKKLFTTLRPFTATALLLSSAAIAHPGHEPDDIVHAIAHELMTPRGIFGALAVAAAVFFAVKWLRGRR
jgi:hypothetical protein